MSTVQVGAAFFRKYQRLIAQRETPTYNTYAEINKSPETDLFSRQRAGPPGIPARTQT